MTLLQRLPAFTARYAAPALVALVGHASVLLWPTAHDASISANRAGKAANGAASQSIQITLIEPQNLASDVAAAGTTGMSEGERAEGGEEAALLCPNLQTEAFETEMSAHVHQQLAALRSRKFGAGLVGMETSLGIGHGLGCGGTATWTTRAGGKASGGMLQPLIAPPPPYPATARLQGRTGVVELSVAVDARGQAAAVAISRSSGFDDFDEAARGTVRQHWRFPPHTENAAPEPILVLVRFDLNRS